MAIGSSNVSFGSLQTEYGGSNPISLSEYYKGGSFVLAHPNNTALVASGAINVSAFFSQSKRWIVAVTISADTTDFHLRTHLDSIYGDFSSIPTDVTVTINSGVTVSSTSTGTAAFNTGSSWEASSTITIVNNGDIKGRGGDGASGLYGAPYPPYSGSAGSAGGNALNITNNVTINNGSGNIFGGGGGGGASGVAWTAYIYYNNTGQAGGGGGAGGSSGGVNSGYYWYGAQTYTQGANGTAGSLSAAGAGGITNTVSQFNPGDKSTPSETVYMYSGAGGAGGTFGAAGSTGDTGSYTGVVGANHAPGPGVTGGGAGGAAGKAINLNGFSATFTAGNNGTQVKGAVS